MQLNSTFIAVFVALLIFMPGCLSGDESNDGELIPTFSVVADDEMTYSSDNLLGTPYILHFSASWCTQCRTTIHAVDNQLSAQTYIVVSTDDTDSEKLSDWHLQVNESQDDSTVDTPFSANAELAESLDIKNTPILILVNSEGVMINRHIGPLTESSDIEAFWAKAA
jgi:cytochrome c biogenesis protein CcmG/thiol:disulfide interchange protein DsbE